MGTENDDIRTVGRNAGSQEGDAPRDGNMASDGYETLDRADGGRSRRGLSPNVKTSIEGMKYYRPRGR